MPANRPQIAHADLHRDARADLVWMTALISRSRRTLPNRPGRADAIAAMSDINDTFVDYLHQLRLPRARGPVRPAQTPASPASAAAR